MLRIICMFVGLVFSVVAGAANAPVLPDDVRAFIERVEACHKWLAEEPKDPVKIKEVDAALKKWQCDTLEADLKAMNKRYAANAGVRDQIQSAVETY